MSYASEQVANPAVRAEAAALAATASVIRGVATELLKLGLLRGRAFDEFLERVTGPHPLRDVIYSTVAPLIEQARRPKSQALTAASTQALVPTRAQSLIASGLLDIGVGIEDLSGMLTDAVRDELNRFVPHGRVRSVIRRALVDLVNNEDSDDIALVRPAKMAREIIDEIAVERGNCRVSR
jgi:hypothetical protein